MSSTEQEAERIATLMRSESDEPMEIDVQCPSCRKWRTIFASVKNAKRAGKCDACELDRARYALRVLIDERPGRGIFGRISHKEYAALLLRHGDAFLEALAAVEER